MRKKMRKSLVLVLGVLALFTACQKSEQAVTEQITSVEKLEDQILYVYSAGPGGLSAALEEAFESETGITVELLQSTTGKILSKLEAEKNNPVADVVVLASWPSAMGLKSQGLTLSYPQAKNVELLHKGFVDTNYELFGYSASALGITYNTNLVENPGEDWDDFTGSEWTGQVNIPDPSLSGSCMDFISGYVSNFGDDGWTLFQGLKSNGITMAGANKAALNPVVTGAKKAVLAGVDYMAYSNKAIGEPVDIIYPKSGTVVNPRAAVIMKSTSNIDAAKRYIDFILSDKAQKLVADAYIIPGRSDIKCDNRANLSEIALLDYDWEIMMANQASDIAKINKIFQ